MHLHLFLPLNSRGYVNGSVILILVAAVVYCIENRKNFVNSISDIKCAVLFSLQLSHETLFMAINVERVTLEMSIRNA